MSSKVYAYNIQWPVVFATALWMIWKDRNKEVFENQTQPPHISVKSILNQAMEIQEAFVNMLHPNFLAPKPTTWSCPSAGKLKLNTDGSSKGDEVGTWVWGYHGYLGNCTSLEAELWDIYRGLTIIMQKGLSSIEIETDSQTAMELVRDGAAGNSPYQAIIEDANFLLRRYNCSIQTTPREANQCADALANTGVNQQEHLVFLENPPDCIFSLLIADMVNVSSKSD